MSSYTI